jgi:hypothetical protein
MWSERPEYQRRMRKKHCDGPSFSAPLLPWIQTDDFKTLIARRAAPINQMPQEPLNVLLVCKLWPTSVGCTAASCMLPRVELCLYHVMNSRLRLVFVIVIVSSYFTIWIAMTNFPPNCRCYRNCLELERLPVKDEQ